MIHCSFQQISTGLKSAGTCFRSSRSPIALLEQSTCQHTAWFPLTGFSLYAKLSQAFHKNCMRALYVYSADKKIGSNAFHACARRRQGCQSHSLNAQQDHVEARKFGEKTSDCYGWPGLGRRFYVGSEGKVS